MPKKHGLADEKYKSPSIIEWLTFGKVGDSDNGEAFTKTLDVPQTMRIHDTGTYMYMGWAIPGSAEAGAVWRVARFDSSGNKLWADGDCYYNNVWTNHESLNYS